MVLVMSTAQLLAGPRERLEGWSDSTACVPNVALGMPHVAWSLRVSKNRVNATSWSQRVDTFCGRRVTVKWNKEIRPNI